MNVMSEQTPIETWKPIAGYEGMYRVSDFGSVWSKKINRNMKFGVTNRGYYDVGLKKAGLRKALSVHRLVALAFIANPLHKKQVDHIDRNKMNNHVENLRWATASENQSNNNYKGYTLIKRTGKWQTQINHNGKVIHIGRYATKSEARAAYLAKAKELKGEFAQE